MNIGARKWSTVGAILLATAALLAAAPASAEPNDDTFVAALRITGLTSTAATPRSRMVMRCATDLLEARILASWH